MQLVVLLVLHPPFGRHAGGSHPLLPRLASITPEEIQITGQDSTSVTLVRQDGRWCLEHPSGYPTLAGKVGKLIQDLGHLTASRQVVGNRRYHAALKVADDDFERRVRIWDKVGGAPALELFVGTSPASDVSHMRAGGDDRVYEVSGMGAYDLPADAGSWIERRLIPVESANVSQVEVRNRHGRFTLAKQNGEWAVRAPASRTAARLDQGKVNGFVSGLCSMQIDQPVGAVDERAQGFANPEATVVVESTTSAPDSTDVVSLPAAASNGKKAAAPASTSTLTLRIGAEVPDRPGDRYATTSDLGYAVSAAPYAIARPDTVALGQLLIR